MTMSDNAPADPAPTDSLLSTDTPPPDLIDNTDPDNPVAVRPTAFSEIHQWGGWSRSRSE